VLAASARRKSFLRLRRKRTREASLFRPENGSYKLLARVQMDEWPRIAAEAK
jgi:hypothetical protein